MDPLNHHTRSTFVNDKTENPPQPSSPAPDAGAQQPTAPEPPEGAYTPPGSDPDERKKLEKQQQMMAERMQQAHATEQKANHQHIMYIMQQMTGEGTGQADPLIHSLIHDINQKIAQICRYAGAPYRPFLAYDIFGALCMPDWQAEWQLEGKPVSPPKWAPYITGGAAERALDQRAVELGLAQPPQATGAAPGAVPQVTPGHPRNRRPPKS